VKLAQTSLMEGPKLEDPAYVSSSMNIIGTVNQMQLGKLRRDRLLAVS
jgi:hypothetical protein